MLCVALREHVQTVSPIRARLCSFRVSALISKLSKVVNAALTTAVSREEKFYEHSRICDARITWNSQRWHMVKSWAVCSHLFSRAMYQTVERMLYFPLRRSVQWSSSAIRSGKSEKLALLLFKHLSRCMRYRADIFTSMCPFLFQILHDIHLNNLLILRLFSNCIFFFRRLDLRWPFSSVPTSPSHEAVCPHSFLAI